MKRNKTKILMIVWTAICLTLFVADMMVGATSLTLRQIWDSIVGADAVDPVVRATVINIRLIKALVAVLVGASLAISGLQMQTLFQNPLAGPYVLGISSGASLGVALLIIGAPLFGMPSGMFGELGMAGAAWLGAAIVLVVVGAVSVRVKDIMIILILGMMFSSGVGAVVQALQYISREDTLKSFVMWTMGSLADVTAQQLWILIPSVVAGLLLAVATIKPMNLFQIGEAYARTSGIDISRSRALIFLSTTLLAGTVTAFCGPIGFVGLAVPHLARFFFSNADCKVLMPASLLVGIAMMLLCDMLSKAFTLPINTLTSLLGIPIVVWIVMKSRS